MIIKKRLKKGVKYTMAILLYFESEKKMTMHAYFMFFPRYSPVQKTAKTVCNKKVVINKIAGYGQRVTCSKCKQGIMDYIEQLKELIKYSDSKLNTSALKQQLIKLQFLIELHKKED